MAVKNITQFFRPTDPDNRVIGTDLISLGRTGNNAGERDIALTGVELFNSMNPVAGLNGAPAAPTSLTAATPTPVTGWTSEFGTIATLSPSGGTITVLTTATYRINMHLLLTSSSNNQDYAMYMRSSLTGDTPVSGMYVPNGAGDVMSFSANLLVNLTENEVLTMLLSSSAIASGISYTIGTFDLTAVQI